MTKVTLAAGAALMLAACSAEVPAPIATATPAAPAVTSAPAPSPTVAAAPALSIDGEGLRLVDTASGRARPIAFGTAEADTLAALGWRGTPERGSNAECGAGPITYARWPDGVTLNFQEGRFAGWSIDRRSGRTVITMAGVGPDSRRSDIEQAMTVEPVPDSTLGTEFMTGGMGGLFDGPGPAATVTDMWAGITCMAR